MIYKNTVRSAFVILAMGGMLAACGSNSDSGANPAATGMSEGGVHSATTQKATVKIASITKNGEPVSIESSALSEIARIDNALVKRETVATEGELSERSIVELLASRTMVVRLQGATDFTGMTAQGASVVTGAEVSAAEGKVTGMTLLTNDGVEVVLVFGEEPKQDEASQDEAKQDEPKQDEAKQDEPKQDEAKQDEPKQDEPKQDEAKQDEAKQDEAKQG